MTDILLVGLGGVFGGLCRFQLGRFLSRRSAAAFPVGTLFINVSGALLLGLLTGLGVGGRGYALLGEGFLGTYTTFSTFMYEGFQLFGDNEKLNAFVYILGSLVLGVLGYVCGYALGRLIA